MRYLKKYNESSLDFKNVKLDIEDILLELKDIQFWTNTETRNSYDSKRSSLSITIGRMRDQKGFIKSEEEFEILKSTLIRIKEYAELNNLRVDTSATSSLFKQITKSIEQFNKFMDDNRFTIKFVLWNF